jgi:hypothetical protein
MVLHHFLFYPMDIAQSHVLGNGHAPILVSEVEPAFTQLIEHIDIITP